VTSAGTRVLKVALVVSMLAAALPAVSLDLSEGRLKLSLLEGTGRFTISYLSPLQNGSYIPLLAAQDPRTSLLSIAVGNKVYRMGESSAFSEAAQKTPTGGRFVWTSPFLVITETFTFVTSTGSPLADGVRIDLGLKNVSEQDLSIGVRYLFDTYLGEASLVHFQTDTLKEVTRELTLTPSDKAAYWLSPLVGNQEQVGLECMLSGAGVTSPDRVVFANWKRLSDSSWSYETSTTRNFSVLPYSVNDSAVAQYYDPRTIAHGAESTVTVLLGKYSTSGFAVAAASTASFQSAVQQSLEVAKGSQDTSVALHTDLATVDRILAQIDAKMAAGSAVSDDELSLMETAVSDLQSRAGRYAGGSAPK